MDAIIDHQELILRGPQLFALGPLLRTSKIEAGDVLLTCGNTMESHIIAGLTGGKYSHAAIFLPKRNCNTRLPNLDWSQIELAESDDDGVGETPLETLIIRPSNQQCAVLSNQAETALILRHPRMTSLTVRRRVEAAETLRRLEFHKNYSPLARLVAAASVPNAERLAMSLSRFASSASHKYLPGTFCSELVAKYFELLDLQLFDTSWPSHLVSPNDFTRPNCVLVQQSDAIVDLETSGDSEATRFGWRRIFDNQRKNHLSQSVKFNAFSRQTLNNFIDAIDRHTGQLVHLQRHVWDLCVSSVYQENRTSNSLSEIFHLVSYLLSLMESTKTIRGNLAASQWDDEHALHATLHCFEISMEVFNHIWIRLNRIILLHAFSVHRRSNNTNWLSRRKIIKLFTDFRNAKKHYYEDASLRAELLASVRVSSIRDDPRFFEYLAVIERDAAHRFEQSTHLMRHSRNTAAEAPVKRDTNDR